ncbi:hypothetical protein GY45DRAFT_1373457 [Cubamyces sp. BRFM 1775]|nr:hypothetical protein GY45DRAFT_1373457 [Cubamyces sp. BRFM 1775]
MQSRSQYQTQWSPTEKKRQWIGDGQGNKDGADHCVKRQRVERNVDEEYNGVEVSDASVDLARYRDEETGDDYSEEYTLDENALLLGDYSPESTATTDIQHHDVTMSNMSSTLSCAPQALPAFFAVDDEDHVELEDEIKEDLLEYINSRSPDDDGPRPLPVVIRPRWRSPGPSPLFQDYLVDQPVTDARCVYNIIFETAKENVERPLSSISPSKTGLDNSCVLVNSSSTTASYSPGRRILKKAIRRFKTDNIGLAKKLHNARACAWLCRVLYDEWTNCGSSPKVRRFLRNRLKQLHKNGPTNGIRGYNDRTPLVLRGTCGKRVKRRILPINDKTYQYRPVFDADGNAIDLIDNSDDDSIDTPFSLFAGRILHVTFSQETGEEDDEVGDDGEIEVEQLQLYVYPDEAAASFWLRSVEPYVARTGKAKSRKHPKTSS